MLTKNDIKKEGTFSLCKDGNFYEQNGDYVICYEENGAVLRAHCEVMGVLDIIKPITSLEDLLNTIDILNIT